MSRASSDTSPPILNIDYWSSLYPVYTDYEDSNEYDSAMEEPSLEAAAEELWDWKGLNRSISFDDISPVLEGLDPDDFLKKDRQQAAEMLSSRLQADDVVSSSSLVTTAFLLHLMDSGKNEYSLKFPIYDRRVWNAYVYLWRIRGPGEQLYSGASTSAEKYAEFCSEFSKTCPDGRAREYERALFMFGRFIMKLPSEESPTPISRIDEYLEMQEDALKNNGSDGFALVDIQELL